jgi:hypothetical protein
VGSRIDRDAVGSMQDATVAVAIALSCGCRRRIGRGEMAKIATWRGFLAGVGTWIPMDSYMEPATQTENRR